MFARSSVSVSSVCIFAQGFFALFLWGQRFRHHVVGKQKCPNEKTI
jgi:hypothetical protein